MGKCCCLNQEIKKSAHKKIIDLVVHNQKWSKPGSAPWFQTPSQKKWNSNTTTNRIVFQQLHTVHVWAGTEHK